MKHHASRRRIALAGFTLVELMVALGLSMILAIVLLKMQAALGQQRMRTSDIAERDTELRASMDLISQDISSTAYLFGNMTQPCDAIFSYNGTSGTGKYYTRHPVDAIAASTSAAMNFASSLTLNYPTDSNASDVLVLTSSNDARSFNDSVAPQLTGDPTSTTSPLTSGLMKISVGSQTAPVVNHMALLETAIQNASGTTQNACFRVPVTLYTSATSTVTSSGNYMPSTFYAGYQPSLTAAGFGALGNGQLLNNPKFVDIGDPAGATQQQTTTAYYIDGSGTFPVLMRSQWSVLNDAPIPGSSQQIAAGVVSLQARFNIGGGVYQTAATTTANGQWSQVCSVRIALITRSINDDPDPLYTWAPTALTPGVLNTRTIVPGAPFSNYAISDTFKHRRFLLQTTELAVRNSLLPKLGTLTC